MKERIYVCHTYYHVYVSFLKELNLPKEKRGQATLVLSKLSTDFEKLKERVERSGLSLSLMKKGIRISRSCKSGGREQAIS